MTTVNGNPVSYVDPFGLARDGDDNLQVRKRPNGDVDWAYYRTLYNLGLDDQIPASIRAEFGGCPNDPVGEFILIDLPVSIVTGGTYGIIRGGIRTLRGPVTKGTGNAARTLGRQGEEAVGIVKNTKHIKSLTGTASYRVPDGLTDTAIIEVKNVSKLSYTNQLRDYVAWAKHKGLRFELYVRESTQLSKPLQEAVDRGDIILIRVRNLP